VVPDRRVLCVFCVLCAFPLCVLSACGFSRTSADAAAPDDLSTPPAGADLARADFAVPPDLSTGLDPAVSVPPESNMPCTRPGDLNECGLGVCRFYSPTENRCEQCGECRGRNMPCTTSFDCDILFQCFGGFCRAFCMLGGTECGGLPQHCIAIGNSTFGLCDQ
jgi:hypothetical protein